MNDRMRRKFHPVLVEQLEVHGRIGGDAEMGAAVAFDRHVAEDPDRRPS